MSNRDTAPKTRRSREPGKAIVHREAPPQGMLPLEESERNQAENMLAANGPATVESSSEDQLPRCFFASNRELILHQLGCMVLQSNALAESEKPDLENSARVLVVRDGLRKEEIHQLSGGKPGRFPVLAEIRATAVSDNMRAIGIADVISLWFRNSEEADDFRFRPVEELDTDYFPCHVDPLLFDLDGPERIFLSSAASLAPAALPALADRIAGAICALLELGSAEEACRDAICDLLVNKHGAHGVDGLGLRPLFCRQDHGIETTAMVVAEAFIAKERAAARDLIEAIRNALTSRNKNERDVHAIRRWHEVAIDVLESRKALDGDILADSGSIILRAALLAAVTDDTSALSAFLRLENPAGQRVVTAAALLIGLKTGLSGMSWSVKARHLTLLSPLLVALHDTNEDVRRAAMEAFEVDPVATPVGIRPSLLWHGIEPESWHIPGQSHDMERGAVQPVPITTVREESPIAGDATGERFTNLKEEVVTVDGTDRRVVKIEEIRSGMVAMNALQMKLLDTDRLRKTKELMEVACTPGICWRLGIATDGEAALYTDVPAGADKETIQGFMDALPRALEAYLVPRKSATRKPRSSSAKSAKKKPAGSEG